MAIAGNFLLNFEIETIFLLMDIWLVLGDFIRDWKSFWLLLWINMFKSTEKADSLLYSLNQN